MAKHVKPSKEELKENINKSLQDLNNLPPADPEPQPDPNPAPTPDPNPPAPDPNPNPAPEPTPAPSPAPEPSPVPEPEPQPSPAPSGEPEPTPNPTPEPTPAPSGEPAPGGQPDYRKKFEASTREAQVLGFKNKEINKAVDDAANLPEPTEEELKKEYPDWDEMTSTEQRLSKENLLNKRRFELIHSATSKFKQVEEWNDKVKQFSEDPKTLVDHPELEGKIDEFATFATKPTRRGLDFEDLILAFLGEQAKSKPAPHRGEMFPQGGSGAVTPPKPRDDKLSPEQARVLMKTNYPEFKRLLKAGKIRNE